MKHCIIFLSLFYLIATHHTQSMETANSKTNYFSEESKAVTLSSTFAPMQEREDIETEARLIDANIFNCPDSRANITVELKMWQTAARQEKINHGLAAAVLALKADDDFFTNPQTLKEVNTLIINVLLSDYVRHTREQLNILNLQNSDYFYCTMKLALYGYLRKSHDFTFPNNNAQNISHELLLTGTQSMNFYAQYLAANQNLDPQKAKYPFIAHLFATKILFNKPSTTNTPDIANI